MVRLILPGLPIVQRGSTFYVAVISAGDLIDNYKVDRWNRVKNADGYQRAEFEDKMQEFDHYLRNPELVKAGYSLIDQTALVNVRGKVSYDDGRLTIDGQMYMVDGQHRAGGLRLACAEDGKLRGLGVPIVLLNVDKDTERARFFIINEKAKSVPTDLAERQLLHVHPEVAKLVKSRFDPEFVGWAVKIATVMHDTSKVWKGAISIRGEAE